jgi:hypothetical protein
MGEFCTPFPRRSVVATQHLRTSIEQEAMKVTLSLIRDERVPARSRSMDAVAEGAGASGEFDGRAGCFRLKRGMRTGSNALRDSNQVDGKTAFISDDCWTFGAGLGVRFSPGASKCCQNGERSPERGDAMIPKKANLRKTKKGPESGAYGPADRWRVDTKRAQ